MSEAIATSAATGAASATSVAATVPDTSVAATVPATSVATAVPAASIAVGGNFYDTVTNPELKTWIQSKGWKGVEAMADSAHNLEKMIGAPADEVFRLPKNPDPATLATLFDRLGRPASADKYELPVPKGMTPDVNYIKAMQETFHKVGLTAAQAKALAEANGAYSQAQLAQQAKDYELGVAADEQALQGEWKNGYDRMMNQASTAAKQLGFTTEMIDGLESSIGYAGTMKFLAGLATKLGEDNFVNGAPRGGFGGDATPAEAKAEWAKLTLDKGFTEALMNRQHPGHGAAIEKKSMLMRLISGGGKV